MPRLLTNAHDTFWDGETSPKTASIASPQTDAEANIVSAWLFTHRSGHYSHWYRSFEPGKEAPAWLELDLNTDNIMINIKDTTMLSAFVDEETRQPNPRKEIDGSRTIYQSRKFRRPLPEKTYGLPILGLWIWEHDSGCL